MKKWEEWDNLDNCLVIVIIKGRGIGNWEWELEDLDMETWSTRWWSEIKGKGIWELNNLIQGDSVN